MKLDNFYHLDYLGNCLHLYYHVHNNYNSLTLVPGHG